MDFWRILITGGAGFVGGNLALLLREGFPDTTVTAFDNLKRRGSDSDDLLAERIAQHAAQEDRAQEQQRRLDELETTVDGLERRREVSPARGAEALPPAA